VKHRLAVFVRAGKEDGCYGDIDSDGEPPSYSKKQEEIAREIVDGALAREITRLGKPFHFVRLIDSAEEAASLGIPKSKYKPGIKNCWAIVSRSFAVEKTKLALRHHELHSPRQEQPQKLQVVDNAAANRVLGPIAAALSAQGRQISPVGGSGGVATAATAAAASLPSPALPSQHTCPIGALYLPVASSFASTLQSQRRGSPAGNGGPIFGVDAEASSEPARTKGEPTLPVKRKAPSDAAKIPRPRMATMEQKLERNRLHSNNDNSLLLLEKETIRELKETVERLEEEKARIHAQKFTAETELSASERKCRILELYIREKGLPMPDLPYPAMTGMAGSGKPQNLSAGDTTVDPSSEGSVRAKESYDNDEDNFDVDDDMGVQRCVYFLAHQF